MTCELKSRICVMRKFFVCLLLAVGALVPLSSTASASQKVNGKIPKACYFYGTFLAGKVQVVTTSGGRPTDRIPTFKVQRVSSFSDLKVREKSSFATKCGEWQYVTSRPQFKVRFVNSSADFKVSFVTSFPGVP